MTYLVEIQKAFTGLKRYEIIDKGFACTSGELLQEIATHCGCKPIDISDIAIYQDRQTAKEIMESKKQCA